MGFRNLSMYDCKSCGKGIKQSLVAKKVNVPEYCYKCYRVIVQGKTPRHQPRLKRLEAGLPTTKRVYNETN